MQKANPATQSLALTHLALNIQTDINISQVESGLPLVFQYLFSRLF